MLLLGILASQLFALKPLKDMKYVDFHKKQSSLLASAGTSTSQSSGICMFVFPLPRDNKSGQCL